MDSAGVLRPVGRQSQKKSPHVVSFRLRVTSRNAVSTELSVPACRLDDRKELVLGLPSGCQAVLHWMCGGSFVLEDVLQEARDQVKWMQYAYLCRINVSFNKDACAAKICV